MRMRIGIGKKTVPHYCRALILVQLVLPLLSSWSSWTSRSLSRSSGSGGSRGGGTREGGDEGATRRTRVAVVVGAYAFRPRVPSHQRTQNTRMLCGRRQQQHVPSSSQRLIAQQQQQDRRGYVRVAQRHKPPPPAQQRRNHVSPLYSSPPGNGSPFYSLGGGGGGPDRNVPDERALREQQRRDEQAKLSERYRSGQYWFGGLAVLLALVPDRTRTVLLASKLAGCAGYGVAAGLCSVLEGANRHDRLSSDTYRRANLGLLVFCATGFLSIPGEAGFLPNRRRVATLVLCIVMKCVQAFGIQLAFQGWKYGIDQQIQTMKQQQDKERQPEEYVDPQQNQQQQQDSSSTATTTTTTTPNSSEDWKYMLRIVWDGTKQTLGKGLWVVENKKKALTYRNCAWLVGIGIFSAFMEGLFNLRYRETFNRTWFEISLSWSAMGRLFMISSMIYSLKDAAERDRLTGTTFIQFNVMIGLWAMMVGFGQSIYPMGFALYRGVEMFAFSFPFFIKALKSQKEKDEQKRQQQQQQQQQRLQLDDSNDPPPSPPPSSSSSPPPPTMPYRPPSPPRPSSPPTMPYNPPTPPMS